MKTRKEILDTLSEISFLNSKFNSLLNNFARFPEKPKLYQTEQAFKNWLETLIIDSQITFDKFADLSEDFLFHDLKISKKFFLSYRSRLKNFGKQI